MTELEKFCQQEAAFRSNDLNLELSEEQISMLAKEMYDTSESWIDSDFLQELALEFSEKLKN